MLGHIARRGLLLIAIKGSLNYPKIQRRVIKLALGVIKMNKVSLGTKSWCQKKYVSMSGRIEIHGVRAVKW